MTLYSINGIYEYMDKQKKYGRRAAIASALAHPTRLQIIDYLHENGSTCVCRLVEVFGCRQPIISKHLNILKIAGLVKLRKDGVKAFYSLMTPCIITFFDCADKAFENHKKSL